MAFWVLCLLGFSAPNTPVKSLSAPWSWHTGAGLVPTGPYLVVALGVQAMVVLSVLVGAVDVATVLTAREPAGRRRGGLRPLWPAALGRTLPRLLARAAEKNLCLHLREVLLGFRGPVLGCRGGRQR